MNAKLSIFAIAVFSGGAAADMVLLDLPSGNQHDIVWSSQSGLADFGFDISSEYVAFSQDNWATPGNVYAWDWTSYSSRIGSITFDAHPDSLISLEGFDLSGFGSYAESAAWIRVRRDGELVFENDFYFNGLLGTENLSFDFGTGSQFVIEIENIGQWASVGVDNIAINSSTVPAPGALALLGLAGVARNRRRRG